MKSMAHSGRDSIGAMMASGTAMPNGQQHRLGPALLRSRPSILRLVSYNAVALLNFFQKSYLSR
jgi:hypothetical protein